VELVSQLIINVDLKLSTKVVNAIIIETNHKLDTKSDG